MFESLKARARQLKAEVLALYFAFRHPDTPWYAKLFLAAIVAYALSPIDLIPDFIPVLGLLDELILLPIAIVLVIRIVPAPVMSECRMRASQVSEIGPGFGRLGAAFVVLLWLGLVSILWFTWNL